MLNGVEEQGRVWCGEVGNRCGVGVGAGGKCWVRAKQSGDFVHKRCLWFWFRDEHKFFFVRRVGMDSIVCGVGTRDLGSTIVWVWRFVLGVCGGGLELWVEEAVSVVGPMVSEEG